MAQCSDMFLTETPCCDSETVLIVRFSKPTKDPQKRFHLIEPFSENMTVPMIIIMTRKIIVKNTKKHFFCWRFEKPRNLKITLLWSVVMKSCFYIQTLWVNYVNFHTFSDNDDRMKISSIILHLFRSSVSVRFPV